jgi:hypothetical protein
MGMAGGSRAQAFCGRGVLWMGLVLACSLFLLVAGAGASTGALILISTNAAGEPVDNLTGFSVPDDGSRVVFGSQGSNLGAPPFNVYVKDLSTGAVSLVSATASGVPGNGPSSAGSSAISHNGRFVAFVSASSNLDPADTVGQYELYVKDLLTGSVRLASTNSQGVKANRESVGDVSDDGNMVVFYSEASNLDPRPVRTCFNPMTGQNFDCTFGELYLKNLTTGAVTLITDPASHASAGAFSEISADGSKVIFTTPQALSPQDTDGGYSDVYVYDVATANSTLVSTNNPPGTADNEAAYGYFPRSSANGHRIVFRGAGPSWPGGSSDQIYLKDLDTGMLTLVSQTAQGVQANGLPQDSFISGDGNYVTFDADSTNLDPAATNGVGDVYLKDLSTGALTLVSQRDDGTKGNNVSGYGVPVNGGGAVIFGTMATNLIAGVTTPSNQLYYKVITPSNPDGNGDGIDDTLQPTGTPSGSFVDSSLSPPTTGSIVTTGGLSVTVTDATNGADGVQIVVGGTSGQATFSVCGGFTLRIVAGSTVTVTCGSVRVKVTAGSAEVVLAGGLTVVTVPAGGDAKVTDTGGGTYSVQNYSSSVSLGVSVDGVQGTIPPGTANASIAAWHFLGFAQPVDNGSIKNTAKAGRIIPLKWQLLDAANHPVTTLTSAKVSTQSLSCNTGTPTDDIEQYSAGASGLQNLGGGYYQFNWQTPNSYANSCKTMLLDIGDGVSHKALFQFTK